MDYKMNTLEEAAFNRNISPNERTLIDTRLAELQPYLDQLRVQSHGVAQDATRLTNPQQYAILNDIVAYNKNLLQANDQQLHRVIQQERELHANLAQTDQQIMKKNGMGQAVPVSEIDKRLSSIQLTYIERLESLDFPQIAAIKKVDRTIIGSFNKIWIWVLEVFFSVPSSKYFWDDFSKKALSKSNDSGAELRRKMIVFDINKLSPMQVKELDGIITSDIPLLADKLPPNQELRNFFDVLGLLNTLYKVSLQKSQQKRDMPIASDVRVIEEEKNAIVASQRLNAVKFDLISDVQNLYLLIDTELK
jgi:hypothetical protein